MCMPLLDWPVHILTIHCSLGAHTHEGNEEQEEALRLGEILPIISYADIQITKQKKKSSFTRALVLVILVITNLCTLDTCA